MTSDLRHTSPFEGLDVETQVPMKRFTSFKVGGPAQFLARPSCREAIRELILAAAKAKVPVTLLGGGTNVLVADQGIQGLVILMTQLKGDPMFLTPKQGQEPVILRALAGEKLASLCRLALERGLGGLEWAAGIPGTLGGALAMNAGSFGSDMAAITAAVEVLDLEQISWQTVPDKDLNFSYRRLALDSKVIVQADLRLLPCDRAALAARYAQNLEAKKTSQPVSRASAGCFFKNPSAQTPAGWLIEQAGLKGMVHKGAMVSDLHANFIINLDQATCQDILVLKDKIQQAVYEKFNINLETEVRTIGC